MAVLNVNGKAFDYTADPSTPLLWVLRVLLGLTGTKYGTGICCNAAPVRFMGRWCALARLPRALGGTPWVPRRSSPSRRWP